MNSFSIVLFIHVLSAIAFFVAITLEGVALDRLRSARSHEELESAVRAWRRLGAIYAPAFIGTVVRESISLLSCTPKPHGFPLP
jgi:hypothetical protein